MVPQILIKQHQVKGEKMISDEGVFLSLCPQRSHLVLPVCSQCIN